MSIDERTEELLALPLPERVSLAEALWASINEDMTAEFVTEEQLAVERALARDRELESGAVKGRTHEEVMASVRLALG